MGGWQERHPGQMGSPRPRRSGELQLVVVSRVTLLRRQVKKGITRALWTAKRSNHSSRNQSWIFTETDAKAEKVLNTLAAIKNWLIGKSPDGGKIRREKGATQRWIVGWHHWLCGHEFRQRKLPGVVMDREHSAAVMVSELDMTGRELNWVRLDKFQECSFCKGRQNYWVLRILGEDIGTPL